MSNERNTLMNESKEQLSNQAQAILNMYGTPNNFIKVFHPQLQDRMYEDKERVFFGRAPMLKYVSEAYSKEFVITWLIQQYEYMNSKASVRQLDMNQLEELSSLTFIASQKLKTSEIQYFILKVRLGEYGDFFGSIDIQRTMGFLQDFKNERSRILADHFFRLEAERQNEKRANYSQGAVTRKQYIEMIEKGLYKPTLQYQNKEK